MEVLCVQIVGVCNCSANVYIRWPQVSRNDNNQSSTVLSYLITDRCSTAPNHRRYSKCYPVPARGPVKLTSNTTLWVADHEDVPRTFLQTLANTQVKNNKFEQVLKFRNSTFHFFKETLKESRRKPMEILISRQILCHE